MEGGAPSRFFEDWLAGEAPFADYPDLTCFQELDDTRDLVGSALCAVVIDHLVGIELLERLLDRPRALSAILERVPTSPREMSGDLGEILATIHVEECSDFRVPIRRLRYKADREFPMLGDDIVALCDAQPPRILKGEAKSKRALNETTVQQADKALNARDGRPKSETLAFLSMRLREHQHDELAECVESFLDDVDDDQIEHLLFTFSGNDGRDVLAQYAQSERPRIRRRVAGVVVTDHQEFIADVFNNVRKAMSG